MKILVAEDERVSRRMLQTILTQWGYEVVAAEDGLRAWQILTSATPPHLAILDWMMPGMDGTRIVEQLRLQGREPYVYVVLLTSREKREDMLSALEAGVDDFLTKPFDPAELKARLRAGKRLVDLQNELIAARTSGSR